MKRVLKKVTAALLAATMVVGLAACGSGNGGSGNKSSKSGKVKIGVSIWSSTDVLGSQCKKMLDAAAKALDVEVQYVDQGHVSEKVQLLQSSQQQQDARESSSVTHLIQR